MVETLLAAYAASTPGASAGPAPETALVNAAQYGHLDAAESLLAAGVSANARERNDSRRTPLIAACGINTTVVISGKKDLVNYDKKEKGHWVRTAQQRQFDMLRLLLDHGADAQGRDEQGCTALMALCELDTCVNVHCKPSTGAELHICSEIDPRPAIELMLEAGAEVNVRDAEGNTALLKIEPDAVELGFSKTAVARLLLRHGADINSQNREGETALMRAVRAGSRPLVELLLASGADVNVADLSADTPLMAAARDRDATRIVRGLLRAGADIHAEDRDGQTALAIALEEGHSQVANLLQQAGATERHPLERELREAAECGDREAVRDLINRGATLNVGVRGRTPLVEAVAGGHADIVADLLAAGADPNVHYHDDFSFARYPLSRAALDGNLRIVDQLLAAGATLTRPIAGATARCCTLPGPDTAPSPRSCRLNILTCPPAVTRSWMHSPWPIVLSPRNIATPSKN